MAIDHSSFTHPETPVTTVDENVGNPAAEEGHFNIDS